MAHLGLLRVLEEEGIPVDMVVGTSVGAFIGGLYAKHASYLEVRFGVSWSGLVFRCRINESLSLSLMGE